jgi:hypothetical protein
MNEPRVCVKCGESKDLSQFRVKKSTGTVRTDCRTCENKDRRDRKNKNKKNNEFESSSKMKTTLTTEVHTDEATGVITAVVKSVGVPADPKEFLVSRGLDPDAYEIIDSRIGCHAVTMKIKDEPVQVMNFNLNVKFVPVKLKAFEFEPIKSLRIEIKDSKPRERSPQNKMRKVIVFPDSQNGFQRDMLTGELYPFHDRRCWDLGFQMIEAWQPDDILLLGDMLDLCGSGKYTSSLEMKNSMELSLHELGFCLGKIRQMLPDGVIQWIPGNHEQRLEKALLENFAEGYGVKKYNHYKMPNPKYPAMSIPFLLGLEDIGVEWLEGYPDGIVELGLGCEAFHGTKAKSEGGDTAKAYLNDGQKSCIYGHIHRNEICWKTVYNHGVPRYKFAASPGTWAIVGGRLPGVKKRTNQQNGMLLLSYDPNGYDINPLNYPIIEGEMFFDGYKLTGNFDMEELCDVTGHDYLVGQRQLVA